LKIGDAAPDLELKGTGGTKFKLSEAKGKNVVLNFLPAAFSGVCSQQIPRIQSELSLFGGDDTQVFGVSVDNAGAGGVREADRATFPLLADFYPHGRCAEAYGVLLPNGVAERAVIGSTSRGSCATSTCTRSWKCRS
jgi:peroxiredoxin